MKTNNSTSARNTASLLACLGASILLAACLAGCGKSLSGTYTGEAINGMPITVDFKSGGKALASSMGQTHEVAYTFDGDKVVIDSGTTKEVYTIQKDGCLSSGTGPLSTTLKKK